MALSNTAVPKYYGRFRESVMRGEEPICREVSMEMARIDDLIANPGVYYDEEAVEGFIAYCENELTLTDGSDLFLLDSFKLWAEQLFGWFYFLERSVYQPDESGGGGRYVRKRIRKPLIKKQYLIIGRGAAKSMYGSCVQSFFLNVDTSTTKQITTAPTMAQADEIMSPIRTSITRARGPYFKFLTEGSLQNTTGLKANRVKLAATKKGIENFMTGSLLEVRPMHPDKLQGRRDVVVTIDEWLSGDVRHNVVNAVEQGASKNERYVILAMSSEGNVRNSVGDDIKMQLTKILKGEYYQPHVSIWWYKLDDISEVEFPELWRKANPNLGYTVQYDVYQEEVEKMQHSPSERNDTLAKRFGLPMEGYTYYFTYEETLPHIPHAFWKQPCAMGADLSRGDDFCAFVFFFPQKNGLFGIKCRCYITERTLLRLPASMRVKYEEFIAEGSLIVMDGSILDILDVYEDVCNHINETGYDVRAFGYDPYAAEAFVSRWERDFSPYGVVKIPQGYKTESVPLGELKILANDRVLIFDESIMTFCMENAIAMADTSGQRKLYKPRHDKKVDCVASMMDAYIAYKLHKEEFD